MSRRMAFPPIPGLDTAAALRELADSLVLRDAMLHDIKTCILAAQEIEAMRLEVAALSVRAKAALDGGVVRLDSATEAVQTFDLRAAVTEGRG